jgi:hypothetical protein
MKSLLVTLLVLGSSYAQAASQATVALRCTSMNPLVSVYVEISPTYFGGDTFRVNDRNVDWVFNGAANDEKTNLGTGFLGKMGWNNRYFKFDMLGYYQDPTPRKFQTKIAFMDGDKKILSIQVLNCEIK